jgi:hypothetical protein
MGIMLQEGELTNPRLKPSVILIVYVDDCILINNKKL